MGERAWSGIRHGPLGDQEPISRFSHHDTAFANLRMEVGSVTANHSAVVQSTIRRTTLSLRAATTRVPLQFGRLVCHGSKPIFGDGKIRASDEVPASAAPVATTTLAPTVRGDRFT
jgi:hypothetical protein